MKIPKLLKDKLHFGFMQAIALTVLVAMLCSGLTAARAQSNTPKEEVVYALLAEDGAVRDVYIVNVFDMAQPGRITDFGQYAQVYNLTTADAISQSGDENTVDAPAGRFYYQGDLSGAHLPWIFTVDYTLDGRPVSADTLAGGSGSLNIHIAIRQNAAVEASFYQHYMLQVSLTLDTEKCENIQAPGATAANVGVGKSLTYTVLPDKEADIEISADVQDFEMDGIQVNGVPFSLEIAAPDTSELTGGITELQEGIADLDDGASQLNEGVSELSGGADTLSGTSGKFKSGAAELSKNMQALKDGTGDLYSGAKDIQEGFSTLNGQSGTLKSGSAQVRKGLGDIKSAVDGFMEQSASTADLTDMEKGSTDFKDNMHKLDGQLNPDLTDHSTAIQDGIDQAKNALNDIVSKSNDSNLQNAISYVSAAYGNDPAVAALIDAYQKQTAAVSQVASGVSDLSGQYKKFHAGVVQAVQAVHALSVAYAPIESGISQMTGNMLALLAEDGPLMKLQSGVDTLNTQYTALDDGLGQYTDGVKSLSGGYDTLCKGIGTLNGNAGKLQQGAGQLYAGASELSKGASKLNDGVQSLSEGSAALQEGTGTLRSETADMQTEVTARIDELLEAYAPGDFPIQSFASARNTQVNSVQFVIRTPDIQRQQAAPPEEAAPVQMTFWQRLLNLFGLYQADN